MLVPQVSFQNYQMGNLFYVYMKNRRLDKLFKLNSLFSMVNIPLTTTILDENVENNIIPKNQSEEMI